MTSVFFNMHCPWSLSPTFSRTQNS